MRDVVVLQHDHRLTFQPATHAADVVFERNFSAPRLTATRERGPQIARYLENEGLTLAEQIDIWIGGDAAPEPGSFHDNHEILLSAKSALRTGRHEDAKSLLVPLRQHIVRTGDRKSAALLPEIDETLASTRRYPRLAGVNRRAGRRSAGWLPLRLNQLEKKMVQWAALLISVVGIVRVLVAYLFPNA